MSHFTVLVVGENPEQQLQPFHEFECTGVNDEYVQSIDITQDVLNQIKESSFSDGLGYYGLDDRIVEDEADINLEHNHKYGYAVVKNGNLIKAVKRTNPNARWDWYQLGGRWRGIFKIKVGATFAKIGQASLLDEGHKYDAFHCDQLRLKDLDIVGMEEDTKKEKSEVFDKVFTIINNNGGIPPRFKTLIEKYGEMLLEEQKNNLKAENHNEAEIIRSGKHKQFVYDTEKERVKCRCGHVAVWWETGFLCGTITAYPCRFN